MAEYGYIRVSSSGVSEAEQFDAMTEAGVSPRSIYVDEESLEYSDRPAFQELFGRLQAGDRLHIHSLDRLAINCEDISVIWGLLTETRGVKITILNVLPTNVGSDRYQDEINYLLIRTLAAISQSERDHLRHQGRVRMAAIKARGIKLGSTPKERPPELYRELTSLWERGEITARKRESNSA
jgi:DNA invertase Pin-like site-specific DNA recombinase